MKQRKFDLDMTQEEKQLLLIDLCARLPYEVMIYLHTSSDRGSTIVLDSSIYGFIEDVLNNSPYEIKEIKPYLRPISSMTEDEKEEIKALGAEFSPLGSIRFRIEEDENDGFEYGYQWLDILDFLNSHHFDYRGLIEKGLALEAKEGMYDRN